MIQLNTAQKNLSTLCTSHRDYPFEVRGKVTQGWKCLRCKGPDKIWKWEIIINECDCNDSEPGGRRLKLERTADSMNLDTFHNVTIDVPM